SERGKQLLNELLGAYERLHDKTLPSYLVRNPGMRESHVGDKVVVTSYHRYDSFAIDKDLFEVVGMFSAEQTLQENLDRLKNDEGIELVPELVDFLFAAGVLVERPKAKPAAEKAGSPADLDGRRAALAAILEARGLMPDSAVRDTIGAGDLAKLDTWLRRAAVATTLDDVFDDNADASSRQRDTR
ncbi:MAG TPA: hypothetical protein VM580_20185, partial [Labilithrix sp.]|nr:hypothetical protein [Labilithrix sp.]